MMDRTASLGRRGASDSPRPEARQRTWRLVSSLGAWLFLASVVLTACSGDASSAALKEKDRLDQEILNARVTMNVPDGLLKPIIAQESALLAKTADGSDSSYQAATSGYTRLYNQVIAIEQMPPTQAHTQAQSDLTAFTNALQEVQNQGFAEATQYASRLKQAQTQLGSASTTKDYFSVDGFIQAQTNAVQMIEPVNAQLRALTKQVDAQSSALGVNTPDLSPQPLQCARGDVDSYFWSNPYLSVTPQAPGGPTYAFQYWPGQDLTQFRAASSAKDYGALSTLMTAQAQQLAADAALAAPAQAYNLLQQFQSDIQTYQQDGGTDTSFQQQAAKDNTSLQAAKTLADYAAVARTIQKHRQSMDFPLLKVQTNQDIKTLQQLVDKAQSIKTHNPGDGLDYPDGYEYAAGSTGIGDARARLANAQTQDDYTVIDEEIQMFITNISAMLQNLNDNTPSDQPHQTDYALIQHYNLTGTKVLMVSLREQEGRAYDNGKFVKAFKITSGNPDLPSPPGVHCIFLMLQNYDDVSPFPKGSPYYYNPTHINFGMVYSDYGYIVHDAWWRSWFGKYSNLPHYDPISFNNGSHGCVNLPLDAMGWLFNWGYLGMPVVLY